MEVGDQPGPPQSSIGHSVPACARAAIAIGLLEVLRRDDSDLLCAAKGRSSRGRARYTAALLSLRSSRSPRFGLSVDNRLLGNRNQAEANRIRDRFDGQDVGSALTGPPTEQLVRQRADVIADLALRDTLRFRVREKLAQRCRRRPDRGLGHCINQIDVKLAGTAPTADVGAGIASFPAEGLFPIS
jgi:hypothetical protein